jgi:hypothetical protein
MKEFLSLGGIYLLHIESNKVCQGEGVETFPLIFVVREGHHKLLICLFIEGAEFWAKLNIQNDVS